MIELFAPKICFAKELKSSWSMNLNTTTNKIPITNVGQVPCLHFEHSMGDWCTGLIPLTKGWEPLDISDNESVKLNYYGDPATSCQVSFKDGKDNVSKPVNISKLTPVDDAVCEITIPLAKFQEKQTKKTGKIFDIKNVKFIQFSGGPGDNFYISELRVT